MKREWIGKSVAAGLIGLSFGTYVYYNFERWNRLGREAYLLNEARRFERFMAAPGSAINTVLPFAAVLVAFLGLYKVIALGITKVLKVRDRKRAPLTSRQPDTD